LLFLRYVMWIKLLSNKLSTSCVWLYSFYEVPLSFSPRLILGNGLFRVSAKEFRNLLSTLSYIKFLMRCTIKRPTNVRYFEVACCVSFGPLSVYTDNLKYAVTTYAAPGCFRCNATWPQKLMHTTHAVNPNSHPSQEISKIVKWMQIFTAVFHNDIDQNLVIICKLKGTKLKKESTFPGQRKGASTFAVYNMVPATTDDITHTQTHTHTKNT